MGTVALAIQVLNASNNQPIPGAQAFINGSASFDPTQSTVTTNSSGNADCQFTTTADTVVLQITATGFQSQSQTVDVGGQPSQAFNFSLSPIAASSQIVSLSFVPATPGIVWTLTMGSNSYSGTSDSTGASATIVAIPYGSYVFTASLSGYQDLSQALVITGQADPYVISLTQTANNSSVPANLNSSPAITNTNPASYTSSTNTQTPNQSEYVYPNSDYDKYFTTIAARIYIGNLFIDECNTIQYALQDNAIPVYGYASRYVDAYGQGRSLVQGQLTLNFVSEGYLYTVLQQYKKLVASGNRSLINDPEANTITQILGMMAARDSLNQQANSNVNDTGSANQASQLQSQISALSAGLTASQMQTLSAMREQQLTSYTDIVAFDNAVYQDVPFDIRIELGNEVTGVTRLRYLEKCKLISNEQIFDQTGQVVLDSYGFIARRLR